MNYWYKILFIETQFQMKIQKQKQKYTTSPNRSFQTIFRLIFLSLLIFLFSKQQITQKSNNTFLLNMFYLTLFKFIEIKRLIIKNNWGIYIEEIPMNKEMCLFVQWNINTEKKSIPILSISLKNLVMFSIAI